LSSYKFNIVTIFPEMFSSPFKESIIKRAVERRIVEINIYDLRNFTHDRHKVTDDYPYGGGAGMMMKPEPLAKAIEELNRESKSRVILMTTGRPPHSIKGKKDVTGKQTYNPVREI